MLTVSPSLARPRSHSHTASEPHVIVGLRSGRARCRRRCGSARLSSVRFSLRVSRASSMLRVAAGPYLRPVPRRLVLTSTEPMGMVSASFVLPLRSFQLEVSLEVEGIVALVGPSGAGKTSVLRAVSGLVRPALGRITLDGEEWFDSERGVFRKPDARRVG